MSAMKRASCDGSIGTLVCLGLAACYDQQPGRSDSTVATAWFPVAVNDLNGDGMVDFALFLSPDPVGPNYDYKLAVMSGRDGSVLVPPSRLPSGPRMTVAPADDLDGDGHPDLLVGISCNPLFGRSRVLGLSGRTFEPVWEITSWSLSESFTSRVVAVFDERTRRTRGVIVLDPMAEDDTGLVRLYSVETRELVSTFRLGTRWSAVECIGLEDVNGDHVSDIAIGLPFAGPQVLVLSGSDVQLLYKINGDEGSNMGTCLVQAPDVDHDGVMDLIIGVPFKRRAMFQVGGVRIVSGRSGRIIRESPGHDPKAVLGDGFCLYRNDEPEPRMQLASVDRRGRLTIHDLDGGPDRRMGPEAPVDQDCGMVVPLDSLRQGLRSGYVICVNRKMGDVADGPIARIGAQVTILEPGEGRVRGSVNRDDLYPH